MAYQNLPSNLRQRSTILQYKLPSEQNQASDHASQNDMEPTEPAKLDKKLLKKGGKLQKGRIFGNRQSKQADNIADF